MENKNKRSLINFFADSKLMHTLFAIILGFIVGALFLEVMGISSSMAYGKLVETIFKNSKAISYDIVYATPYIVAGLSVAFSFKTGVFNIGAEGQFVIGSISACVVGILGKDLPSIRGIFPGLFKALFNVNEVITSIMFNWIAFYLSNFIADTPGIKQVGSAEATQNISANARILLDQNLINNLNLAPTANWGILVAIILCVLIYIIIEKTTLGYELKAVGFNRFAAEYGGINVNSSILTALAISGALSGLAGALQLMGMSGRISIFTGQEGFGFAGIVVALIGLSNPIGVFLAGLFYGALKYGGRGLNLVGAPTQVVDIIVGTVVFFISISSIFEYIKYIKIFNKKEDK